MQFTSTLTRLALVLPLLGVVFAAPIDLNDFIGITDAPVLDLIAIESSSTSGLPIDPDNVHLDALNTVVRSDPLDEEISEIDEVAEDLAITKLLKRQLLSDDGDLISKLLDELAPEV